MLEGMKVIVCPPLTVPTMMLLITLIMDCDNTCVTSDSLFLTLDELWRKRNEIVDLCLQNYKILYSR